MSSGLYCKGRRRTLRWSRCRGSYARPHKRRESRVYTRVRGNVEARRDKLRGSGSYCYGYYLPLIRMKGQIRGIGLREWMCACVCCAYARVCGGVYTRKGTEEARACYARLVCSWTHYRRERDRAWLQTPLSLSAPRPDPRDFQDTRHTTHKPHTLCGVNQLDPSSLRPRYRYNGAARRNETFLRRWRHLNADKKMMVGEAFIIAETSPP